MIIACQPQIALFPRAQFDRCWKALTTESPFIGRVADYLAHSRPKLPCGFASPREENFLRLGRHSIAHFTPLPGPRESSTTLTAFHDIAGLALALTATEPICSACKSGPGASGRDLTEVELIQTK
jgi:hypothetical protein